MKYLAVLCSVVMLWASCNMEEPQSWNETDLMSYGVPLKIKAPDSIDVKVSQLGGLQDITIKGDHGFSLQVFGMDMTTTQMQSLVSEQRSLVQEERIFNAFEEEWDAGFIYSSQVDSNVLSYDFRHIRLQGDKQYVFQSGMFGVRSKEEVNRLVEAVRLHPSD